MLSYNMSYCHEQSNANQEKIIKRNIVTMQKNEKDSRQKVK